MANLKNVIYLSNEDYEILVSTGTVTIDGETLTYDENNVYVTPDKLASSTEDGLMSAADKNKLDNIASGAEVNVQADWNQANTSADDYIKNKPSIPTVNNGTLSIQGNGTTASTFTANQSNDTTLNIKGTGATSVTKTADNEITIETKDLVETIWAELKTLRDNSQLIPGRFYRITDYQCTTITTNTSSAGHQFDIIVRADSVNKLNENANAIQHAGDTYFANSKLEAWQLWYCLDNDTTRFAWADSTNGKGVIYRMIDEFGNDCPYDFKNILFTSVGKYTNAYTFSYTNNGVKDASLLGLNKSCYNNKMKEYISTNKKQLNFNVFYSTSNSFNCYSNTLDTNCYSNIFGYSCRSNTFGSDCYYNTFGDYCYTNIFGNGCQNNTFGNNYISNIFGNDCVYNVFGDSCRKNTFGNSCNNNIFSNSCNSNTFGNGCQNNTFGNSCYHNTFVGDCCYITFGDSSSAVDYCQYTIIDNGCEYLYIIGNGTASSSNKLQNIHIHLGVQGTELTRKTITVDRGLAYTTDIYPIGSVEMFM